MAQKNIEKQKKALQDLPFNKRKIIIYNKSDIYNPLEISANKEIQLSAKTGTRISITRTKISRDDK